MKKGPEARAFAEQMRLALQHVDTELTMLVSRACFCQTRAHVGLLCSCAKKLSLLHCMFPKAVLVLPNSFLDGQVRDLFGDLESKLQAQQQQLFGNINKHLEVSSLCRVALFGSTHSLQISAAVQRLSCHN